MRLTTMQDIQPPKRSELPTLYPKDTAAVLRRLLKAAFPSTAFSVTIGRGSGVSSVTVRWTDGPSVALVKEITAGFEAGSFDGMRDIYEYDRSAYLLVEGKPYRPGTRYIFESRDHSPAFVARAARAVLAYRWAWDAGVEAKAEALVTAIEANPCRETVNTFYEQGRTLNIAGGGWDLCQLTNRAMSDRTTCTPTSEANS